MDNLAKERRSWNMSRIKGANTGSERKVRSILHCMGYRFRLHRKDLPGKPDITLPKYKTVVFVHGCFWHRHKGCKDATLPKTRRTFWRNKLEGNAATRDRAKERALRILVIPDSCYRGSIFASLSFPPLFSENSSLLLNSVH